MKTILRKYPIDQWSYSERARKWVYVAKGKDGSRKYLYQKDPPEEFVKLSMQIKDLNRLLNATEKPEENERLFKKMMEISKKMQKMSNIN
ncbi:MAG: hypothetical protein GF353_08405 [Candidatus Lokiarchaeota archaeon]|nr:hypothetical protein [Candidatus Lokiarchaeota archaeon]